MTIRKRSRRTATERQADYLRGRTPAAEDGQDDEREPTVTELQAARLLRRPFPRDTPPEAA